MANQINIDIGAAANDGTGDPLRTAFNYVNLNFANVWATGLPNSNVQFNNNRVLTVNTNANLVLAPNGTGIVQSNVSILPNTDRVHNLGSAGKKWDSIYANYLNISDLDIDADLVVGGNLTVEGNTIQIGNIVTDTKTIQLANTANTTAAANGSGITVGVNDNIATLLYSSASNVWTTNIGITASANVTASYFIGNTQGSVGNITNLDSLNFTVENISALVGNNGVNIGAGGYNNLLVLPTEVLIQNVPLSVAGNIISTVTGGLYITANTVANGTAQIWNFGTDGRLTFPGTPIIDTDANNFDILGAESISLEANAVVNIYTDTSGNAYQWQFGDDGMLTAPGTVKTGIFATGNIPSASTVGAGARAFVTDADILTWGNLYVGGAANAVPVWSNGTNWYIG